SGGSIPFPLRAASRRSRAQCSPVGHRSRSNLAGRLPPRYERCELLFPGPAVSRRIIYVANARLNELQKFFTLLNTLTGPVITGIVVTGSQGKLYPGNTTPHQKWL